jgi:large subunit ribosomal protein L3
MIQGIWGRKVGMTQVFAEDNSVIPVTVVNISGWFVTQIKTEEVDGYTAIQVACLRNKYEGQPFAESWLKNLKKYWLQNQELNQPIQKEKRNQ